MVLRVPKAPLAAREAARAALATPAGFPGLPGTETPAAVQPHQTFHIDLYDLVTDRGAGAARASGWRWLLRSGERVVGAVEVGTGRARVTQGPFASSTASAFAVAQRLPQTATGRYEPRLLHVPALYMCALWLADLDGWRDVLVPLSPAPPGVQALRPYPAAELADLLSGRARRLVATGVAAGASPVSVSVPDASE